MASRGDCSLALSSHLSVLPYSLPPSYRCALSTGPTTRKAPRWSYPPLQHFRISKPLFAPPHEGVQTACLAIQRSRPQGLATLSAVFSHPNPWEPISSPNTLGVHLPELLPLRWSKNGFPFSIRPCTVRIDRPSLRVVLRRFHPIVRAVSLTAHSGRLIRNGTFPLSRVFRLSGSPSQGPMEKASPFSHSPHAVRLLSLHRKKNHQPRGFAYPSEWRSPKWVPPCLAFLTDDRIPPFKCCPRCGLFFRLKVPRFLTKPQRPIFATKTSIA